MSPVRHVLLHCGSLWSECSDAFTASLREISTRLLVHYCQTWDLLDICFLRVYFSRVWHFGFFFVPCCVRCYNISMCDDMNATFYLTRNHSEASAAFCTRVFFGVIFSQHEPKGVLFFFFLFFWIQTLNLFLYFCFSFLIIVAFSHHLSNNASKLHNISDSTKYMPYYCIIKCFTVYQ